MKTRCILLLFLFLFLGSGFTGCSSEKDMIQRRGLMMPEKTDLPRNSKYVAPKKKKTYKPKKVKKKKSNKRKNR